MADRLFKTPLRALDAAGDGVSGAKVYLYETGTSTPVTAYTDSGAGTAHPTPLVADGGGTFAEIFVSGSAGVKVDVTDSAGASLDGYPVDPVLPESASNTGASNVSFAPTTEIPETDVQAAVEAAALLLGVSSNDTTPAYLEDKLLVAGDGLSLSTQNDGANETRTITSAAATETAKGTVEKATSAEGTTPVADKYPDTVVVDEMIDSHVPTLFSASGSAPMFACRAWVNFNGTGTVAIDASGNVSSITDNGVGDYSVNFTTDIEDVDYSVQVSSGDTTASDLMTSYDRGTKTVSLVRVWQFKTGTGLVDIADYSVAIFR